MIANALAPHIRLGNIAVQVNGSESPLYRPHHNSMKVDGKVEAVFKALETFEVSGVDGGIAAVGWVIHHEYSGALSNRTFVKGLRLRSGNIQVGDHSVLESLFPEPRFNSWAVGEIHIVDPKILANGQRVDFQEHHVHLDNVLEPARSDCTRHRTSLPTELDFPQMATGI